MSANQFHENYDRVEKIKLGSEKAFGITFAAVFALLALAPMIFGHGLRLWALIISLLFAATAFVRPSYLQKPNHYWMRFGLFLNRLVSPIILALLFFGVFLPIGLLMRAFGKDVLNLKYKKHTSSYWIISPEEQGSMTEQF